MKKNKNILIILVLLLAMLLASQIGYAEKIKILVLSGGYYPAVKNTVKEFTKKTGIDVEVVDLGYAALREKIIMEGMGHSSAYDLYSIDGSIWMPDIKPFLEPLKPYIAKDEAPPNLMGFVPSMLEMSRYPNYWTKHPKDYVFGSGKLYTLPVRVGNQIMFYRKDLLKKNNLEVPKTWKQFLNNARKLTQDTDGDGKVDIYGVVFMGQQSNWGVWQWVPILWSHGGKILDISNKEVVVDSSKAVKALNFFATFFKEGLTPPGSLDYNLDKAQTAMAEGVAAMSIQYSPRILVYQNPEVSTVVNKVGAAPIPADLEAGLESGIGVLSGWGIGINKYSKHKDAAYKLIKHLTSESIQTKMAVHDGNAPTQIATYLNPDFQSVFPAAQNLLDAFTNAKSRPGLHWTEIEDILALRISEVICEQKTAEKALAQAKTEIEEVLGW